MTQLFFWKNWQKNTQYLFFFAFLSFLISIALLSFFHINYLQNVIHWDVLSELGETSITVEQHKIGQETLSIPAKAFFVSEQFLASTMAINTTANGLYLCLACIALALIHTGLTFCSRIWYLALMGLNVFLLMAYRWDLLLNKAENWVGLGIILGCIVLSYTFHALYTQLHALGRFIGFFLFFALAGGICVALSPMPNGIAHLASYQTLAGIVGTGIIAFGLSYAIPYTFLTVTTSQPNGQSLLNFTVLTFTYLANVLLVFLHNNHSIDWQMLYLSPFLLLVTSCILGLWQLKARMTVLAAIIQREFAAVLLLLGLGIWAIATCMYAFATANDPLIEVLEDLIVYSHLVMGTLFYLYVLVNFYPLFTKQMAVHKVVFKPINLPIYVFRIVALIVLMGLFSMKSFFIIYQTWAGFYNALGDNAVANQDYTFAEITYKQALSKEYRNHKTNYALASLALWQNDNETAAFYFKRALEKNPSPFAYEGLARSFADREKVFDALFVLKEGLTHFPANGELQNNLAYFFVRTQAPDSALFYYQKALSNSQQPAVVAANLRAFWTKFGSPAQQAEALQSNDTYKTPSYLANTYALSLSTAQKPDHIAKPTLDTALNVSTFALLYNQALWQKDKGDYLPLESYAMKASNDQFSEDLLFAHAIQQYYKGDKQLVFEQLWAWATNDSTAAKSKYYRVLLNTFIKKEAQSPVKIQAINNATTAQVMAWQHPLNADVLDALVAYHNRQKHPETGYQLLNNALKWRQDNAKIWQLYILQALSIGMKSYADEALAKLQKSFPTDYQRFLPQYQAKIALIEKQNEGFQ